VDDHSLEAVWCRLRRRTEVVVQIQSVLKLKSGMYLHFEECFEVKYDALKVDDENLGRLLYHYLFGDLLDLSVAVRAEIV